ncbi:MAG: hypothetical protein ACTSVI_17065, partial [Promethearchaeota archaeon]
LKGEEPFFLPLSNGLLFLGDPDSGIAIIKNASTRHVALRADKKWIGFFEACNTKVGHHVENVSYELIFYEGSLDSAIQLANLVNVRPIINLKVL